MERRLQRPDGRSYDRVDGGRLGEMLDRKENAMSAPAPYLTQNQVLERSPGLCIAIKTYQWRRDSYPGPEVIIERRVNSDDGNLCTRTK